MPSPVTAEQSQDALVSPREGEACVTGAAQPTLGPGGSSAPWATGAASLVLFLRPRYAPAETRLQHQVLPVWPLAHGGCA